MKNKIRNLVSVLLVMSLMASLSVSAFAGSMDHITVDEDVVCIPLNSLPLNEQLFVVDVDSGLLCTEMGEYIRIPALAYMPEPIAPMSTTVTDSTLISQVSNPSNGRLRIRLRVPAGVTVTYSVDLIPNNHNTAIDNYNGSYTNNGTTVTTKTINVDVNYFSNLYTVSASYYTGPDRDRTYHVDEESAVSGLVEAAETEPHIWTEEDCTAYRAGEVLNAVAPLAFQQAGIIMVEYYFNPLGAYVYFIGVVLDFAGYLPPVQYAEDFEIMSIPEAGAGFYFGVEPRTNGYVKMFYELDADGEVCNTVVLGTVTYSTITPVVK